MALCQEQTCQALGVTTGPMTLAWFPTFITRSPQTRSFQACCDSAAALEAGLHLAWPLAKSCNFHWSRGLGNAKDGLVLLATLANVKFPSEIPIHQPHVQGGGVGFRGLFIHLSSEMSHFTRDKLGVSSRPPCGLGLTLSCTREFAGVGESVCKSSHSSHSPRAAPSLWGGTQVSEIFFFGYTTCGISVPQSGTEPSAPASESQSTTGPPGSLKCFKLPSDQDAASPGPTRARPGRQWECASRPACSGWGHHARGIQVSCIHL